MVFFSSMISTRRPSGERAWRIPTDVSPFAHLHGLFVKLIAEGGGARTPSSGPSRLSCAGYPPAAGRAGTGGSPGSLNISFCSGKINDQVLVDGSISSRDDLLLSQYVAVFNRAALHLPKQMP